VIGGIPNRHSSFGDWHCAHALGGTDDGSVSLTAPFVVDASGLPTARPSPAVAAWVCEISCGPNDQQHREHWDDDRPRAWQEADKRSGHDQAEREATPIARTEDPSQDQAAASPQRRKPEQQGSRLTQPREQFGGTQEK
jgi:hypothetical protein